MSGGRTVHPAEIERRLAECPGIQEVALTSEPDPVWGDLLVALVVGGPGHEELDAWCRRFLPSHLRPRRFVRLDRLPRTALGKLERRRPFVEGEARDNVFAELELAERE